MRSGLVGALVLGAALAQAPRSVADGHYQGVAPGSSHVPGNLPGRPGSAYVTWPGFKMLDGGGSMVFVQAGREPELKRKDEPGQLVWLLEGLRLPAGNLRRPLLTQYFDTPVEQVQLVKRKGGVALVIRLKSNAPPPAVKVDVERADSGYYFVKVTFPPA